MISSASPPWWDIILLALGGTSVVLLKPGVEGGCHRRVGGGRSLDVDGETGGLGGFDGGGTEAADGYVLVLLVEVGEVFE